MPMKLASAFSRAPDVKVAADELSAAIEQRLGAGADQLTVFATEDAAAGLSEELARRFPGAVIFGGTSCRGVVTDEGVHFGPHVSAVLAMRDSAGACGGGHARIETDQCLAPGDPARAERSLDLLVVNPRAV